MTAKIWPCTNTEYHADRTAESFSTLKIFDEFPLRYHGMFVADPPTVPKIAATPAMLLGTALHALLLEPDKFEDEFAIEPECDKRTKAGKEIAANFALDSIGKTILDAATHKKAKALAAAAWRDADVRKMLEMDGYRERGIRWTHLPTRIDLKARPDIFSFIGPMIDVKTARDASNRAWESVLYALKYYRQAALYIDGIKAVENVDVDWFIHIVVETEDPPYRARAIRLDPAAIELGRTENEQILHRLAEAREKNVWPTGYEGLTCINLPHYAYRPSF